MKNVQTLTGADIDSDQTLVVAKICTRLTKIIRFQREDQSGIWRNCMVNEKERRMH